MCYHSVSVQRRNVLKTLFSNSLVLIFVAMFLDLYVFLNIANAWLAFDILDLNSFSVSPLVVKVKVKVKVVFI